MSDSFCKTYTFEWMVGARKARTQFKIDKMILSSAKFDILAEQINAVAAQSGWSQGTVRNVREALRETMSLGDDLEVLILPGDDVWYRRVR